MMDDPRKRTRWVEVSSELLAHALDGEWSHPLRFRFTDLGDDRIELIFQTVADDREAA